MFDTVIRAGAVVDRAIIDKQVSIGPNAVIGTGTDVDVPNQKEPERLNTGITIVGKRAIIPASAMIGRNVRIGADVRPADFPSRRVRSGGSVDPRAAARQPRDIPDATRRLPRARSPRLRARSAKPERP